MNTQFGSLESSLGITVQKYIEKEKCSRSFTGAQVPPNFTRVPQLRASRTESVFRNDSFKRSPPFPPFSPGRAILLCEAAVTSACHLERNLGDVVSCQGCRSRHVAAASSSVRVELAHLWVIEVDQRRLLVYTDLDSFIAQQIFNVTPRLKLRRAIQHE